MRRIGYRHTEKTKQKIGFAHLGMKRSKKTCDAISRAKKGKPYLTRRLPIAKKVCLCGNVFKYRIGAVADGNRKYCSQKCQRHYSHLGLPSFIKGMRLKSYLPRVYIKCFNPICNNLVQNIVSNKKTQRKYCSIKCAQHSKSLPEVRQKLKNIRHKFASVGKFPGEGHGYIQGWIALKSLGTKIFYHSSYERDFLKICDLDSQIISVSKAPFRISYFWKDNECGYYPDYLITFNNGNRLLIEIKANNWINDKKIQCKLNAAYHYSISNSMNFSVFTEKHIYQDAKKTMINFHLFRANSVTTTSNWVTDLATATAQQNIVEQRDSLNSLVTVRGEQK